MQLDSKILEQGAMSGIVDAIVVTGLSSIPNFISENFPIRMMPFSEVGLQFYWLNTLTNGGFLAKNKELVDNVQMGILEGMKFMLLNPQEAMERHLKEHEELAIGKNGKLYVELGLGMTRAIMMAPESIEHGLGYTDLAKIDAQAKVVKQYAAAPNDREPPKAETFCTNNDAGKVTLTAAEWDQVRTTSAAICEAPGQELSDASGNQLPGRAQGVWTRGQLHSKRWRLRHFRSTRANSSVSSGPAAAARARS